MNSKYKKQPKGYATKAIHAGQKPEQWNSMCIIPPICMSTTYKQDAPGEHRGFEYSRSGNPTRKVLEECLAALDNAKFGLTFSSGLGAATAVLTMLSAGDHLVVCEDLYGGTNRLIRKVVTRLGLEATFADLNNAQEVKSAIQPNTKLVWAETPSNPLMKVLDLQALSKIIHDAGDIIFAVDNTFLTSYFQRPLELGADMVCYSLTKYMNGHSDVLMGAVTMNCAKLYERLKFLQNAMGIVPSPFDCYQVNRSLKTLAIRMEQHQKNSLAVAKFLESHDFVEKVLHPGLPSHPQYEISLKQTYGYSGIFSFYIKGNLEHAKAFVKALKLFALAESLGGYESLVGLPVVMTHASVPAEDRKRLGITESLIRVSAGLEDADDLIEDIKNALDVAQKI